MGEPKVVLAQGSWVEMGAIRPGLARWPLEASKRLGELTDLYRQADQYPPLRSLTSQFCDGIAFVLHRKKVIINNGLELAEANGDSPFSRG
jgi:hypothetical protein